MPGIPFIPIDEFDYELPADKIAGYPLEKRDGSKLLIHNHGTIKDAFFYQVSDHLPPGGILVLNNSRVIAARLLFQKETGGSIEIFCLEPKQLSVEEAMLHTAQVEWKCFVGGASKWKGGTVLQKMITVDETQVVLQAKLLQKEEDYYIVLFSWTGCCSFAAVLDNAGAIPLPPYIKRAPNSVDSDRYQTVFAQNNGSVAAPTAALHFTEQVFQSLKDNDISKHFVSLHVGAGTFKPMNSNTADAHQMHSEAFSISVETLEALMKAETIVAVGTTSLRTLESLYWLGLKIENGDSDFNLGQWEAYTVNDKRYTYSHALSILLHYLQSVGKSELRCRTSLMILPGYSFKSAKAIVTNFHQPRSTLLLLIAAFIGEEWKQVYKHALENNYRFLSYGDSSLLWRKT